MSLSALLFNRSDSVDSWTQTDIDAILFHGDRMYLHALTNEIIMVPDTNTLSINELPKVATSQTNVEYCLYDIASHYLLYLFYTFKVHVTMLF